MKGGRWSRPVRSRDAAPHARARLARCVECGKVWAPTKEEARRLRRAVAEYQGREDAIRYYECAGGWHWTRKGAR